MRKIKERVTLSNGEVYASSEVILSLGAFGSPKCLMLSGIGPEEHLKEKNIELLINVPGVGENLHDHPVMPMNWAFQNNNLSFLNIKGSIELLLWD